MRDDIAGPVIPLDALRARRDDLARFFARVLKAARYNASTAALRGAAGLCERRADDAAEPEALALRSAAVVIRRHVERLDEVAPPPSLDADGAEGDAAGPLALTPRSEAALRSAVAAQEREGAAVGSEQAAGLLGACAESHDAAGERREASAVRAVAADLEQYARRLSVNDSAR